MSYATSLANIQFDKTNTNCDVRCRDLYIDGDIIPPISGDQGVPALGFSLINDTDIILSNIITDLRIDDIGPGSYVNNLAPIIGDITVPKNGIYNLSAIVNYEHNFNVADEYVTVSFVRNASPDQILASCHIFYPSAANDIISIPLSINLQLNAGDVITLRILINWSGGADQIVKEGSNFSVQLLREII